MVYIRTKKIKGIDYAYLVHSKWDQDKKISLQETIKYLGKASEISPEDIPKEYQNVPKITAFLSAHSPRDKKERDRLFAKMRKKIFTSLISGDLEGILRIYETFSKSSPISDFYDNLLKLSMYEVGDFWEKKKISISEEHIASNIAQNIVTIIKEKTSAGTNKGNILICVPEGEWHNLGCSILEAFLTSKGYKVFNISPSVPHESIVGYIQNLEPDVVMISLTLVENISSCHRLIKKIKTKVDVPIIVGGQGIRKSKEQKIDAILNENDSLDETHRSLKSLMKK